MGTKPLLNRRGRTRDRAIMERAITFVIMALMAMALFSGSFTLVPAYELERVMAPIGFKDVRVRGCPWHISIGSQACSDFRAIGINGMEAHGIAFRTSWPEKTFRFRWYVPE